MQARAHRPSTIYAQQSCKENDTVQDNSTPECQNVREKLVQVEENLEAVGNQYVLQGQMEELNKNLRLMNNKLSQMADINENLILLHNKLDQLITLLSGRMM